jgi:hypothetical protein
MIKATMPQERAAKDKEDVKAVLTFANVNVEAVKQQAKKDGTHEILENLIE